MAAASSASRYPVPQYAEDELKGCVIDETSFATLFPRYLELQLQKMWPTVQTLLKTHHLEADLDVKEGSMTVRTTRKTWDPYVIVKARDFLKLLARSVPLHQAQKILRDEMTHDIIKLSMGGLSKERFRKRRQRLIGPEGKTLKALELLTECFIKVQGNTVSCMGTFAGIKKVRKVVEDCMNNIHPIYGIKRLLVQRELESNPEMKDKDWSRLLPTYRKKARPTQTPEAKAKAKSIAESRKRPRETFPAAPVESKLDRQMQTGQTWLDPAVTREERAQKKQKTERKRKSKEEQTAAEQETDE